MVHLEDDLDPEVGTLFDGEWLVLESINCTGCGHVDDHIGASLNLQG